MTDNLAPNVINSAEAEKPDGSQGREGLTLGSQQGRTESSHRCRQGLVLHGDNPHAELLVVGTSYHSQKMPEDKHCNPAWTHQKVTESCRLIPCTWHFHQGANRTENAGG